MTAAASKYHAIFQAVDAGDLKALSAHLAKDPACAGARGPGGCTPLIAVAMRAAGTGAGGGGAKGASAAAGGGDTFSARAAQALLACGSACDPNACDGQHQTALHWALKNRNTALAQVLIAVPPAPVASASGAGAAAAAAAAAGGAAATGAAATHARVMADDFGRLPLHWVVQSYSHAGFAALLPECLKGVSVDAPTRSGDTALHWAAREGDDACVAALLSCGANAAAVNDRNESPAHVARTEALRLVLTQALSAQSPQSLAPAAAPASPALAAAPAAASAALPAAAAAKPKGKLTIALKPRKVAAPAAAAALAASS